MTDDSLPVEDPPRADPVMSFISGMFAMLVASGTLFGILLAVMSKQDGVDIRDRLPLAVGVCVACGLLGGVRAVLLARRTRRLPRMAIGALLGAMIGAVIGAGFVPIGRGHGPPDPLMVVWCAFIFALVLGLRTLQHDH
jgi:peptidoglycan/LPS O-acetylase OafA/YrhL